MDHNKQTYIDELLAKWLSGEINDGEWAELQEWKNASEENEIYTAQFEKLWNNSVENDLFSSRTNAAWSAVQSRITAKNPRGFQMKVVYRYAAVIAACFAFFLLGKWYFQPKVFDHSTLPVVSTGLFIQAGDSAYSTILPDKTEIILQPHSSITADTGFGKYHRTLVLRGNAHFSTKHGRKHTFTVRSGNTEIRDIGTAFWVYENRDETSVLVTDGSVRVFSKRDSVLLQKGDSAVVNRLEEKIQVIATRTAEKAKAIMDKVLVFSKTELKAVTELLNAAYHSDIRLGNPKIANCKFTASFDNEKLDNVLEVIRETFNLEVRREGSTIYLDGKGCQ